MSALLESLAEAFEGDDARRAALEAVVRGGLPGPRSEAWKYTSLRSLERRRFASAAGTTGIAPEVLAHVPAPRIVFVNGCFDAAATDLSNLPDGIRISALSHGDASQGAAAKSGFDDTDANADNVFARLGAALARDGVALHVDADLQAAQPLHLVFVGTPSGSDIAWHVRNHVTLGRGAQATLVEHHLATAPHANFSNALTQLQLGHGAHLLHARVQDDASAATTLLRTDAVLADAAHYQRIDLELGAALSRHELNVRLQGEGARVHANGVLYADGRRQLDTRLGIEHIARDTTCELAWRGLAAGRGRAAFHGGIIIQAGADGADANLSNKNLLLSENAEIATQPVLEIHADEVKAAHGATVGQLDPTALFYLRSRGIPELQARRLMTVAFCREVVAGVGDAGLRQALEDALDGALARLDRA